MLVAVLDGKMAMLVAVLDGEMVVLVAVLDGEIDGVQHAHTQIYNTVLGDKEIMYPGQLEQCYSLFEDTLILQNYLVHTESSYNKKGSAYM